MLWGLFFAALLVLEKLFLLRVLEHLPRAAGHGYLLLAAVIGFAVFNADRAFRRGGGSFLYVWLFRRAFCWRPDAVLPFQLWIAAASGGGRRNAAAGTHCRALRASRGMTIIQPAVLLALLLVCTAYLVDGSFNPFLYFRF